MRSELSKLKTSADPNVQRRANWMLSGPSSSETVQTCKRPSDQLVTTTPFSFQNSCWTKMCNSSEFYQHTKQIKPISPFCQVATEESMVFPREEASEVVG